MKEALPDFAVVGVARAGTTSLANWLAQHPELHFSPVKETNFFSRPDLGTAGPGDHWLNTAPEFEPNGRMRNAHFARIETPEEYRRCFAPVKPGARLRGEASVSYAFYPQAPARLAAANPGCKIVFVLRNPVTRAISNYALFRKLEFETLPLDEALAAEPERIAAGYQFCWAYAGLSRYREAIGRYLQHFPAQQIHVVKFEDLIERKEHAVWCELLRFLGVDESFVPFLHHYNDTKEEQSSRPVSERAKARLETLLLEESKFYRQLFASEEARRVALEALAGEAAVTAASP